MLAGRLITVWTRCAGMLAALGLVAAWPAQAAECAPDGLQESGSIYRICMPAEGEWNGALVVWAHGFQDATAPVAIPEEQLSSGDLSIPDVITSLGFAFATNSYSKTGLAIRQGMDDLLDLVNLFTQEYGSPTKVYLTGASEGGIITTLLVEGYPEIFAGGLAACGPIGDFAYQINYFGNARVLFQYFFPFAIPGDPFDPAPELVEDWRRYYEERVRPLVFHPLNRRKLDQFVRTARLPFDPENYLETVELSVRDVLRYSVVDMKDATETLGGNPFDNQGVRYAGSRNDFRLNRRVIRRTADPAALEEMRVHYTTSGQLTRPLMTIHTLLDQQVPYAHEALYSLKTARTGAFPFRINLPIDRYGHCNFEPEETLALFSLLLLYGGDLEFLSGVGSLLDGPALAKFETMATELGIPYRVEGGRLRLQPE